MNKDNIFSKYKIPLAILIITYAIFIFYHWINAMGLYFDIPVMFSAAFIRHTFAPDRIQFLLFQESNARNFTNLLVAIPLNIIMPFIKNQPALTALKAFSLSYFIIHILFLIANFFVARRTKRYDIAIWAFAFYFILSVVNAIWVVREIHIAMLAQFIILNYFLSKEELKWFDFIPILLIETYLFESFETSAIFSLIMFIASIPFIKKRRNNIHRIAIGLISLAITFYIPIKLMQLDNNNNIHLPSGIFEWISHHEITLKTLFLDNLLIPIAAFIAIIFIMFFKKDCLKNKYASWGGLFFIAALIYIIYKQTGFAANAAIEILYYSPILWFIFPLMIILLTADYFDIDIEQRNPNFYPNLVLITCIFGCLNLLWQINSANDFGKYKNYLEELLNKSEEVIIKIPEYDLQNNPNLRYLTCFGLSQQSVFLQNKNRTGKIILPDENSIIYNESCATGIDKTYYDPQRDILRIQDGFTKVKTKYWDLTPVKEEFIKTGRVKRDKT